MGLKACKRYESKRNRSSFAVRTEPQFSASTSGNGKRYFCVITES
jgi:hypothetical protein